MAYDYIKRTYGLTFTPGERVRHDETGKSGKVVPERSPAHYVHVLFDGDKRALPCHPGSLKRL